MGEVLSRAYVSSQQHSHDSTIARDGRADRQAQKPSFPAKIPSSMELSSLFIPLLFLSPSHHFHIHSRISFFISNFSQTRTSAPRYHQNDIWPTSKNQSSEDLARSWGLRLGSWHNSSNPQCSRVWAPFSAIYTPEGTTLLAQIIFQTRTVAQTRESLHHAQKLHKRSTLITARISNTILCSSTFCFTLLLYMFQLESPQTNSRWLLYNFTPRNNQS